MRKIGIHDRERETEEYNLTKKKTYRQVILFFFFSRFFSRVLFSLLLWIFLMVFFLIAFVLAKDFSIWFRICMCVSVRSARASECFLFDVVACYYYLFLLPGFWCDFKIWIELCRARIIMWNIYEYMCVCMKLRFVCHKCNNVYKLEYFKYFVFFSCFVVERLLAVSLSLARRIQVFHA